MTVAVAGRLHNDGATCKREATGGIALRYPDLTAKLQPAAQYLRMSTDGQRFSLQAQADLIAAYALREGFTIVRTYQDEGRSGVTTRHRKGMNSLLRDVVLKPPWGTILVADVSRWGRYQDHDEAAHYEFICRKSGVNVRYCAESFDEDGSLGSAMVKNLKRLMAAEYSRQLSEKVRAGLRRTLLQGGRSGGSAPYGFLREAYNPVGPERRLLQRGDRKGRQDYAVRLVWGPSAEVATVQRIFKLFVRDVLGAPKIARILNEEGVPHCRPGVWNTDRVQCVLRNEITIGVNVINRTKGPIGGPRTRLDRAEWGRITVLPPMISKAVFNRAQDRLKSAPHEGYREDELLAALSRLLKVHGTLSRRLVAAYGIAQPVTYVRKFGTLSEAFRRVGFERPARDRQHVEQASLDRETVIAGLRRLLVQHGYLSIKLINASGYLPAACTLIKHFGTLTPLYLDAGYAATRSEMLQAAWERRAAHPKPGRQIRLPGGRFGPIVPRCA